MNVLIFVMTMLMLLAMLTYARLQTFRGSQAFQVLFSQYMEKEERSYINQSAEELYANTKAASKPDKGESTPRSTASSRISLALLRDKKERELKPYDWQQRAELLKSLMTVLYEDQPFFQQMLQENPSFLDDLLTALVQSVDALPDDQKLNKAADFANLRLSNEQLDEFFYKMLHGAACTGRQCERIEPSEEVIGEKSEEGEFKSPQGYFSLLDFVNLAPSPKIRLYLAPRAVLMAIFKEQQIVNEILEERKKLHKEAVAGADLKELESKFKSQFDSRRDPSLENSILDYSVTKTNPKPYE